jgi:hypothetical protein
VANLLPVSTTPAVTVAKFAVGVVDTGSKFCPDVILRGLEENDSLKKTWSNKSLDTVPLKGFRRMGDGPIFNLTIDYWAYFQPDPSLSLDITGTFSNSRGEDKNISPINFEHVLNLSV